MNQRTVLYSLCEQCEHCREVVSGKGSRFLRCHLATEDKAYPKYPPQPVGHCSGFQQVTDQDDDPVPGA